jgi:hypothetical protein
MFLSYNLYRRSIVSVLHGLFDFAAKGFVNPAVSHIGSENQKAHGFGYAACDNAAKRISCVMALLACPKRASAGEQENVVWKRNCGERRINGQGRCLR